MFTVTLLTNPDKRGLDYALVDSLRNAWGGGDAVWLAPDEAAEFAATFHKAMAGHLSARLKRTTTLLSNLDA